LRPAYPQIKFYLFFVDAGSYRAIPWNEFFVYDARWLVFINSPRLSPPVVVPPRLTVPRLESTRSRP
ncbi:hypothetical protein GOODEAATRI_011738, partial [Goodea atripinnis]